MSIEFPLGNPAPAQWFSGEVHMAKLDDNVQIETVNVSFEAGGRTNWHTHPVGQNIIVLSGLGIYEAEGSLLDSWSLAMLFSQPPGFATGTAPCLVHRCSTWWLTSKASTARPSIGRSRSTRSTTAA